NDGESAHRLLHPRYGTTKEYYVDVDGEPMDQDLRLLVRGIRLDDGIAKAESAAFRGEPKPGIARVAVVMREGRRREVRRMFDSIGFPVRRLFRRRFGPIDIGRLAPGEWRYLTEDELSSLVERSDRKLRQPPAGPGRGRTSGTQRKGGSAGGAAGRAGRAGQDRSDRAERAERPRRSGRSGVPARPERAARPGSSAQSDRPNRPRRSGASEQSERPTSPRL